MAVFHDDVVGSWARRHEGAREAFDQGGREGLARAGFVPPAFLPVGATMFVVAAMLVWVLTVFFREGHRWGQLGLTGLVAVSVFASVDLGLLLDPPPVFVVIAVVSLLVEGVLLVCPVAPRHAPLPRRTLGRRTRGRPGRRRPSDPSLHTRSPDPWCGVGGEVYRSSCSNTCSITRLRRGRPRPPSSPGRVRGVGERRSSERVGRAA